MNVSDVLLDETGARRYGVASGERGMARASYRVTLIRVDHPGQAAGGRPTDLYVLSARRRAGRLGEWDEVGEGGEDELIDDNYLLWGEQTSRGRAIRRAVALWTECEEWLELPRPDEIREDGEA